MVGRLNPRAGIRSATPREEGGGTRSRSGGGSFTPSTTGSRQTQQPAPRTTSRALEERANSGGQRKTYGMVELGELRHVQPKAERSSPPRRNLPSAHRTEIKELSWDEYDALSPRQRAAIDANTALYGAASSDRENRSTANVDQSYQDDVVALFGEARSRAYSAPETVRVLQELGMKPMGDLNDYLSLGALATTDDVAKLGTGEKSSDPRALNARALSRSAMPRLAEALASGQSLLQRVRGEEPSAAFNPLSEQNQALTSLFDFLSRTDVQQPATDAEVGEWVQGLSMEFPDLSPEKIYDYFDARLRESDYAEKALGENGTYMTTEQFRKRYFGG